MTEALPEMGEGVTPTTKLARGIFGLGLAAVVIGAVGTGMGLAGGAAEETWWMLLVNFLFWTGIAQGMFVWAAIFRATQATWTPAVNRLGHAAVWFLPFSLALFGLLYGGREHWLTWLHHPVPSKAVWLNEPFFFARNAIGLLAMTAFSFLLLGWYRRAEHATGEERARLIYRVNSLAIFLVILYTGVYTMLAFDLVMSLEPHWFSSLFGAYFFVGNLYLSMAVLVILAAVLRRPLGLTHLLGPRQFRDMGNLLMGFGLLTTGFFFAQYLTIWYGNLPEETSYLIRRAYSEPWANVGLLLLAVCYLGPFFLLMPPAVKMHPRRIAPVACLVVLGMWLERWVLVVPTFAPERLAGLGPAQWAIPLACAGVLALCVAASLRARPSVSSLDMELELSEGVAL